MLKVFGMKKSPGITHFKRLVRVRTILVSLLGGLASLSDVA